MRLFGFSFFVFFGFHFGVRVRVGVMNLMTPTCTFGIWHVKYNKYDSDSDSVSVSDSQSDSQSDYDGLMATSASTSTWPEHPNSIERTPKMEILQGKTNKAAKCGAKGKGEAEAL